MSGSSSGGGCAGCGATGAGASPPVGGSTYCPCEAPATQQVVTNPPNLAAISYRVEDFSGFRQALLQPLPGEQALTGWHPAPGDLGLQLLEWWAVLGDILTFYNERIANEDYLRTAQQPADVAGLVGLIGYRPAPGLAATGTLAAIRTTTRMSEPLVIPQQMQVSSTATPGVPAQTFEVSPGASFPGPSDVSARLPPLDVLPVTASGQPASVLLSGKVTSIKAGDQLALAASDWGGTDDNWALVSVDTVTNETDPGSGAVNTRISFSASTAWGTVQPAASRSESASALATGSADSALGSGVAGVELEAEREVDLDLETSSAHLMGEQSFGLSGSWTEAGWTTGSFTIVGGWRYGQPPPPPPQSGPATGYRLLRWTAATALWNRGGAGVSPSSAVESNGSSVNLSSPSSALQPGDLVLFDGGSTAPSVLALVSSTSPLVGTVPFPEQLSPPSPDLVLPYTQLSLQSDDPTSISGYNSAPGAVSLRYGLKDVGTVIANPIGTFSALPQAVFVPASFSLPAGSVSALVQDANGVGASVVVSPATAAAGVAPPPGSSALVISAAPNAPASFATPLAVPLRILLDLIQVSRGVTVASETLGSGCALVANQRFALQKSPLTYLASGASWTSTLTVYVNGVAWTEVPTLYGQAPNAQVYVVQLGSDQSATLRFGDGVTGARPATGNGNITATYRYGSGSASPPAGRLTTIVRQQTNLSSLLNPIAVSGGLDPQSPADVRTDAPQSVLSFGRAISADDYEVVASQAAGVTRCKAYWSFNATAQRMLVNVYVNNDSGGVATASAALAGADDPNRPVAVLAAQALELTLSCTLMVAANQVIDDVVAAATAALSDADPGAFGPTSMGIGQWLYRSYLEAALTVSGVVAVHDLVVGWSGGTLGNHADPGEGNYFDLQPANLTIVGVHGD